MIYFDNQIFNDQEEVRLYCARRLAEASDGDYQTYSKYDLEYDCDQDWAFDR
jgi:hypothetical protein